MAITNKNAASEDQLGILHNAITKLFNGKADALLRLIEEDPDAAIALVSGKDIGAMCKWVLDNGITAVPSEQLEQSELSKKLKAIKEKSQGKVINFVKEA